MNLFSAISLSPTLHLTLQMILPPNPLSQRYPTLHIHWEIAINISKSLPTQKQKTWKLTIKLLSTIPLSPKIFFTVSPKATPQYLGSTVPNSSYSFRNHNFHATTITAQKTRKIQKLQFMIELLSNTPLSSTLRPPLPMMLPPDQLALQFQLPISIEKPQSTFQNCPRHQKKHKNKWLIPRHWWPWCCWRWCWWWLQWYLKRCCLNRPKKSPYSLIKRNQYFKKSPNTKKW